ncbi:MAG: RNA 2',3'-cyclic phosphodiesterase [Calditrichaeota bacterium]|nr:MAG: RNA 2',3'-cyclic phosphodiesterase [Calditrichota bacterium]
MKRLFIAIDFPEQIKQRLSQLCYGLKGARWIPTEQFHITLKFIGDTNERDFVEIQEALREIEVPSFELKLKGLGCFPPRKEPKVLWVGIEKNESLLRLRNKVERTLAQIGVEREQRKFSPHLTLARLKNTTSGQIGNFIAANGLFQTESIPISEFHLYSSVLTEKGAIHKIEETYFL